MLTSSGFKKTEKQKELVTTISGEASQILAYGGARSGKTAGFVYAMGVRGFKARSRHLILRAYFNHAKTSIFMDTLPKILNLAFPGAGIKPSKSDSIMMFPNKSEIWVGGLDDKERAEKILGTEYSTIFFNEISQMSYESVVTAQTRLAEKNSLIKKLYYDMNPTNKRHWAHKLFIEKKDPESGLLLKNPEDYAFLHMNPVDNAQNIDPSILIRLQNLPASKKKRFYDGEFSEEMVGAVFNTKLIKRVDHLPPDVDRIAVGYDPAVTSKITSDEHGIIVCARKGDTGFVIADYSGIYTPHDAAVAVCSAYKTHKADIIVGETNNGGDYIETVLKSVDKFINYKSVHATRGKVKRAEPVASLYEQGRIYHFGFLPELEGEMDDFMINEDEMLYSPNRNDGLVWSMAELFNLYDTELVVRYV